MKSSLLISAWRKDAPPASAGRGSRSRRAWHLNLGSPGRPGLASNDDDVFDGSWHECSRTLAQGLQVTEWLPGCEPSATPMLERR